MAFNLLAGGTGIAPCLQFLRRAKAAEATVRMLYSCWKHEDVLLAAELEEFAANWPDRGGLCTRSDEGDERERAGGETVQAAPHCRRCAWQSH